MSQKSEDSNGYYEFIIKYVGDHFAKTKIRESCQEIIEFVGDALDPMYTKYKIQQIDEIQGIQHTFLSLFNFEIENADSLCVSYQLHS